MPQWDSTRRNIFIAVIIIIALLLAYAFYRLLSSRGAGFLPGASPQAPVSGGVSEPGIARETPELPVVTPLPSPTAGLEPQIADNVLRQLTDFPVISPVINKNQDRVLFYKKDGGSVYEVDFAANQKKLSNITIVGLTEAPWSPARDRAGVFYLDNDILKSFLHIGTSSVISLPRDIKSFSWSPDGKQFAYLIQTSSDNLSLVIADAGAKTNKEVFTTPILDAQLAWISPDTIVFQTAPSGRASGFMFLYSLRSGAFRRILGPLPGLTGLWSPDAKSVLTARTSAGGKTITLSLNDSSGAEIQQLDFTTLPEKCAWLDAKEFYCAVPGQIPSTAIMPDDYLRGEVVFQDQILSYRIDTRETKLIFSGGAMDITNMAITQARDYLIFVNKTDGTLWRLKLKK